MNSFFYNKVFIITGSTQGIGLETGKQLLKLGAQVVFNGRRELPNAALNDLFRLYPQNTLYQCADVGNEIEVSQLIHAVIKRFGKINGILLNAGMASQGPLHLHTAEVVHTIVQTNLLGAIWLTQKALPELIKTRGHVVFISSAAALCGIPEYSLYSATKKALNGLAESLYSELYKYQIHVGLAIVGFTENETFKTALDYKGHLQAVPRRTAFKPMPRAKTAACIIQQLARRKTRIVTGWSGRMAAFFSQWFPALYLQLLKRHYLKNKASN